MLCKVECRIRNGNTQSLSLRTAIVMQHSTLDKEIFDTLFFIGSCTFFDPTVLLYMLWFVFLSSGLCDKTAY